MTCHRVVPLLDAFVDGELPPERVLEVEEHLEKCGTCVEHVRVVDAVRLSTQRAVRQAAQPTDALRARIEAALRKVNRPVLLVAGSDDSYALRSAAALAATGAGRETLTLQGKLQFAAGDVLVEADSNASAKAVRISVTARPGR